jgi:transcriptional regulator with XRE-family HTH domain
VGQVTETQRAPSPGGMASRIRTRRERLGLSVVEAARRCGISREYMHRLERSGAVVRPSADVIERLARVLETTAPELLGQADAPSTVPESLVAYLDEMSPPPVIEEALLWIARHSQREGTRDDWVVVYNALRTTVLGGNKGGRVRFKPARPAR